jgi:hypothetical protein
VYISAYGHNWLMAVCKSYAFCINHLYTLTNSNKVKMKNVKVIPGKVSAVETSGPANKNCVQKWITKINVYLFIILNLRRQLDWSI